MNSVVQQLIDKYHPEDHAVELVAWVDNKRVTVAKFSEGNNDWEATPAGLELITPKAPEVEAPTTGGMPGSLMGQKNINVRAQK